MLTKGAWYICFSHLLISSHRYSFLFDHLKLLEVLKHLSIVALQSQSNNIAKLLASYSLWGMARLYCKPMWISPGPVKFGVIQPASSVFTGMSHFICGVRRRGQWVLRGAYAEEDGGGHCWSSFKPALFVWQWEYLSKYLHLHYCLFLSTTDTHAACISISATFFFSMHP